MATKVHRGKPNSGSVSLKIPRSIKQKHTRAPGLTYAADLLERLSGGFIAFDSQMNCVYVNSRGADRLGRKPDDLAGKNLWVEFPESKGTPFADACARALKTQIPIVFEEYYAPSERWFENHIHPSRDGLSVFFTEITERSHPEGRPRESSEESSRLFQGILRSTSDGILAVNAENEVLFANERFIEMWMIPQELMATKDDSLLLQHVLDQLSDPPGFLQQVRELYNSAEESFDTLYFKDGRVFERLSRPLMQEAELRGRVWSFRDITGRKRIEDALSASETELRALFASMHDVVLVVDRQGVYRKIAPTNPGLLVKPPEDLLGRNLKDVFPLAEAQAFSRVVQEVLDTKQNRQIEYELMIGGQTMWFQTTISPLNADSTLWVAHDITRRKKSEEALRTAEANYRSIFENATIGIYQSTPQGGFLDVNPVMARIFGYESAEEMLNSIASIEDQYYVDPADRLEFQRLLTERGEVREFISRNRRKDGGYIWGQENARAVRDADGNILHYEGFITDITERKQGEEDLQRAKEALETANLELQRLLEREKTLACTDGLTGLFNHRHFFELAEREFHSAVRHQHPLAFLMFDMDDFKQVNDTLGHTEGDKLLVRVARTALAHVRASDVVARYGGDEFIIMLPQANGQEALPVAERIRASIAALHAETTAHHYPLPITLSIGIAQVGLGMGDENVERVIQHADEALYKAKQNGRNRTVIYDPYGWAPD